MKTTTQDGPLASFQEETLNDLAGKEGFFVEPGTAEGTVKLLATVGKEIGVVHQKPDARDKEVVVRLLGVGGIIRVKAGGVIAQNAKVLPAVGGKGVSSASGLTRGRKMGNGSSAVDDLIEVLSITEYAP